MAPITALEERRKELAEPTLTEPSTLKAGESEPPDVPPESGPMAEVRHLLWRFLQTVTIFGLGWLAWQVAQGRYYTTRSTFAFYLGVAGGLMMVALLSYPIRKHLKALRRFGALKHWFRLHMYLGIAGPILILFHSTFHVRSPNAGVALVSMLLVVISGVIGRFVYRKIHKGLYGSRMSFDKTQEEFWGAAEPKRSRLHFAPKVEQRLEAFKGYAFQVPRTIPGRTWHFLTLGFRRRILRIRCKRDLKKIFRGTEISHIPLERHQAMGLADRYLKEVQRVAQFQTYERLFSLWHVLHIPLIYLLAASGIFHVIAVYMY